METVAVCYWSTIGSFGTPTSSGWRYGKYYSLRRYHVNQGNEPVCHLSSIQPLDVLTIFSEQIMQINIDALVSLQVFLNEKHASIYSKVMKEGLSIYGELFLPTLSCLNTSRDTQPMPDAIRSLPPSSMASPP